MGEQGPATHTSCTTFHACCCAVRRLRLNEALSRSRPCAVVRCTHILLCERVRLRQVGPYNNPQETYNYYYLPFCQPSGKGEKPAHKWGGLGEVLQGNELIDSQLDLKFRSAPCASSSAWPACMGVALGRGRSTGPVNLQHVHAAAVSASPRNASSRPKWGQLRVALLASQPSIAAQRLCWRIADCGLLPPQRAPLHCRPARAMINCMPCNFRH